MIAALFLLGFALVPWEQHHRPIPAVKTCDEVCIVALQAFNAPGGIRRPLILDPWNTTSWFVPRDFDVVRPPSHPDARPWPQGMVIGMGTPSVDPGIVLWDGSPIANVMSVFLAPWVALAHRLDS